MRSPPKFNNAARRKYLKKYHKVKKNLKEKFGQFHLINLDHILFADAAEPFHRI
jgi:hypothetical protein